MIESRERTSTSTTLGPVSPRVSLRRDAMKISQLVSDFKCFFAVSYLYLCEIRFYRILSILLDRKRLYQILREEKKELTSTKGKEARQRVDDLEESLIKDLF